MSRLAPKKRDGARRPDDGARDRAGGAIESRGHVDGEDRTAAAVHGLDDLSGDAIERPRKPRAEQGVDDEILRGAKYVAGRRDRAVPPLRHGLRVALQAIRRDEAADDDLKAALREDARGDEPIAAVVARAAEHRHTPLLLQHRLRRIGDGAAGILH